MKILDEPCEPLFKSQQEYEDFRQYYIEAVAREIEKWKLARIKSIEDSNNNIVD